MHIMMIHSEPNTFPADIRVEKEIKVLAPAGYKISILCRKTDSDQPDREEYCDGVTVFRHDIPMPKMGFPRRYHFDLIYRDWIDPIAQFIQSQKPDIAHVHDLAMVPTTLKVAQKFHIPVVADMHENLPAAYVAFRSQWHSLRKLQYWFIQNYHLWRWHEKRAARRARRIIIVTPEQKNRFLQYGIPEDNIVIVSNTEDETTFSYNPEDTDPEIVKRYEDRFVACYIGAGGAHRGLDTAVKAIPRIVKDIPYFLLLLVGSDLGRSQKKLLQILKEEGVENNIELLGYQPFKKVNSFVAASNVCLIPHKRFEHTERTVPHKLFQYMICARPVISSDCLSVKRIIEEGNCGLLFTANDHEDLARKIIELYNNPEKAKIMGENGKKAALGPFAWRHDAKRLLDMYESLEQEIKKGSS